MSTFGIGIIGCGNIAETYLSFLPRMRGLEVRAVADINMAAARDRASVFGVRLDTPERILAAADIDLIVNLTVPAAHFEVSKSILLAGKHVYSEKPLVLSVADGERLQAIARRCGRRVGAAPDTWFGGSHQAARAAIDEGRVGRITGGVAHMLSHGMEHWHPAPDFFYQPGGGPMLDVGPYYVTNLVQLLGPVESVAAFATTPRRTRKIGAGPRAGETIPVDTPTHVQSILCFRSGAVVTLSTSWNVRAHRLPHAELFGTEGSLVLPDPNFFGGAVEIAGIDGKFRPMALKHALGTPEGREDQGKMANFRSVGVAEMVQAIRNDRPHRCSLALALHVVDVMTGILKSGESGTFIRMTTCCKRPAPLRDGNARELFR